jgi:hypothetical protein
MTCPPRRSGAPQASPDPRDRPHPFSGPTKCGLGAGRGERPAPPAGSGPRPVEADAQPGRTTPGGRVADAKSCSLRQGSSGLYGSEHSSLGLVDASDDGSAPSFRGAAGEPGPEGARRRRATQNRRYRRALAGRRVRIPGSAARPRDDEGGAVANSSPRGMGSRIPGRAETKPPTCQTPRSGEGPIIDRIGSVGMPLRHKPARRRARCRPGALRHARHPSSRDAFPVRPGPARTGTDIGIPSTDVRKIKLRSTVN